MLTEYAWITGREIGENVSRRFRGGKSESCGHLERKISR
jgi:hypothetical protein